MFDQHLDKQLPLLLTEKDEKGLKLTRKNRKHFVYISKSDQNIIRVQRA